MKRYWMLVAALSLVLIGYQNCAAPLEESTTTQPVLRVLSSPTPVPTAPPIYNTPTPTPIPTATPVGATPTPAPTPVPVETVLFRRFVNGGLHYIGPAGAQIAGWAPEEVYFKFYKNPGANRQRVYQCSYGSYWLITVDTGCEVSRSGARFANPQDMGVYVSMQQNDEATTVSVYRKAYDTNPYIQLFTSNRDEAVSGGYSTYAGFGFIPQ